MDIFLPHLSKNFPTPCNSISWIAFFPEGSEGGAGYGERERERRTGGSLSTITPFGYPKLCVETTMSFY